MLKSLRTSTKLLLLCSVFVGALAVANYSLVAEKQIAIQFVRKELVGVEHLEALRGDYATILTNEEGAWTGSKGTVRALAETGNADFQQLDTSVLEKALADALGKLTQAVDADQRRSLSIEARRRGSGMIPISR